MLEIAGSILIGAVVFYGWEILVSNSQYRRWREQSAQDDQ